MNNENQNVQPKKRSLTSLTLDWLAEKVRRSEKIRDEVRSGAYKVESEKIAEALLHKE